MQNLKIVSEPHAGPETDSFVREAIARHNVAATGHTYYSPLAIFLKDERDAMLGGALGHVWEGWLDLSLLPRRSHSAAGATGRDFWRRRRKKREHRVAGASS